MPKRFAFGIFFAHMVALRQYHKENQLDIKQRTLKKEIGCTGVGLHCGEKVTINIKPAPANTGIRFIRVDMDGHPEVEAKYENVLDTTLATTIGENGCAVSTIEHIMAAFFGMGIDNALVELDGREVPVMDGSSAPFVFLIWQSSAS